MFESWSSIEIRYRKESALASLSSKNLPFLVNGWHGGDMRITLTFSWLMYAADNDWMFLLKRFVLGKLCLYTSLATVFMSAAVITSPLRSDSEIQSE